MGLDSMTLECYNSKAVKKNTLQQSEEQTTQRGTAVAAKAGKDLGFSILLDYYGMVLTEKQRNILTEYYNDDLSLAEIAENYGITRQGVRDAIKHGEATLMEMEEKLGTARRTEAIRADLARLEELVSEVRVCNTGLFEPDTRVQRATEEMLTIIHRLDTQEELPDGI